MVTQIELGWLAGIIDGEGSILIVKRGDTFVPCVKMANTSKVLTEKFCNILDRLDISYNCYGKHKEGNRKYQWDVHIDGGKRVMNLLLQIQDILVCKQKQAFKVMEWIESRKINKRRDYSDSELQLRTDVMTMNARGRSASEN